jgi:hypothetical protein
VGTSLERSGRSSKQREPDQSAPTGSLLRAPSFVLEFFFIPVYKTTRLQFNAMASPVEIYGKAIFLGCRGSREKAELALREAAESTRLKTMAGGVQANTL